MQQSRNLFATVWLNIGTEGALDRFFLEKAITRSGEGDHNFAHFDHSICCHQCGRLGFSTSQFILGFSSCWGISLTFPTSETHSTVKEDSSGQSWIFVNLCRYIHFCVDEVLCFFFILFSG